MFNLALFSNRMKENHQQVEKVDIIDRVEGKKQQQQKVSKKLLMGPKLVFSKKQVLTRLVLLGL